MGGRCSREGDHTFKVIGCADLLGRFSAEDTFVLQLLGVVYDGRDGGNDGRALG